MKVVLFGILISIVFTVTVLDNINKELGVCSTDTSLKFDMKGKNYQF